MVTSGFISTPQTAKRDFFCSSRFQKRIREEPARVEGNLPDVVVREPARDYNSNAEPARVEGNLPEIWGPCQTDLFNFEGNLSDIKKY